MLYKLKILKDSSINYHPLKIQDISGQYDIIGSNQNNSEDNYCGKLFLTVKLEDTVSAKWIINNNQEQYGTGYLKNNLLTINFYYYGHNNKIYKGKVVYRILTKDILEGTWTEEYGDKNYVGTENCFRVKNSKIILN